MKIVITGASGFLGRHICENQVLLPHELVLVDRDRKPENMPVSCEKSRFVRMDLASAGSDAFARLGSPDLLIHLAWGELNNFQSPGHMTRELPMHFTFLDQMVRGGLRRMMVLGTCFEYGLQNGEMDENQLCHPATWYGLAKYTLLRQLEFLQKKHAFELVWPRLFYMYGEGQAANSIYPQLMRAISANDTEFRMSAGEQIRDYLPVGELVDNLCRLALSPHSGVVNVCSGQPISLRRQVENWIAEKESPIQLRLGHYPYRDYEPFAFWGSTRRLRKLLGDAPANSPLDSERERGGFPDSIL